ncbi:MAG: hypothetical protein ACXU9C_19290 [Xanthobacteraceae bacterium]
MTRLKGLSFRNSRGRLSPDLPDRVAEVLAALVKNPRFDRWVYMTQSAAVRAILENGLASGSPVTASVVTETINYFSTMGDAVTSISSPTGK